LVKLYGRCQEYAAALGSSKDGTKTIIMLGLPDSRFVSKIGQFANDNGMIATKDDIQKYIEGSVHTNGVLSVANTNSKGGKEIVIKALRDIDEGEEIFLHYGIDYWLHHSGIKLAHTVHEKLKKDDMKYFDDLDLSKSREKMNRVS
jgi:SET domain-containing protein